MCQGLSVAQVDTKRKSLKDAEASIEGLVGNAVKVPSVE